jgi:hypothetical protein
MKPMHKSDTKPRMNQHSIQVDIVDQEKEEKIIQELDSRCNRTCTGAGTGRPVGVRLSWEFRDSSHGDGLSEGLDGVQQGSGYSLGGRLPSCWLLHGCIFSVIPWPALRTATL